MTAIDADLCFVSQPLEIIHKIIMNGQEEEKLTSRVLKHFRSELLDDANQALIPHLRDSKGNQSLVSVPVCMVVQDCLDDEFFVPLINLPNGEKVNAGLWSRFPYDPNGKLHSTTFDHSQFAQATNFQVRKRLLAKCVQTGQRFVLALYCEDGDNEVNWDKWRQETFKINSLHNLIGILEEEEEAAEAALNGPESIGEYALMTIHLIHRSEFKPFAQMPQEPIDELRPRLLKKLSECLAGSEEAAEALLLTLVSRPAVRVNGLIDSLFIGKLTLNLNVTDAQCCPQTSLANLMTLLRVLKPLTAGPLGVSNDVSDPKTVEFATMPIYPQLDVQSGLLNPSHLQQPDGTVLVVDETSIKEGEFKDQAVRNLQSLIDLIQHQQLTYDFGMQQISLKTDIPIILFTCAKASILPFNLKVDCSEIKEAQFEDGEGEAFRAYIEHCRNLTFNVTEEIAEFLENDYLALRKSSPRQANGNPVLNEQEFHKLMNLARLRALSHAQSDLTEAVWEETKRRYLRYKI